MKGVPLGWQLLLLAVLITLNAIFACAEIAMLAVSSSRLSKLAGDKRAARLGKLTGQPARFLINIQIAITFSGFLASTLAAGAFVPWLVDWLVSLGVTASETALHNVSLVVVTLVLSYFMLLFGELLPKRLATRRTERLALGFSGFISGTALLLRPMAAFLNVSTNALLRLLGFYPNAADDSVTEEEIRMMVDEGSEKGAIDSDEKEWIQNIFEFDDITAGEICTHRTDMSVLWLEDTEEQWRETIEGSRHTIYPMCDDSVDNVVGILKTKDYFRLKDPSRDSVLEDAVTQAYFVPESIKADALFRNMRESRKHFAVVLDEYGGVTGIVTMNDLLEQLVGELDDEGTEPPVPEILPLGGDCWEILGATSLDDVEEALDVGLPTEAYDTFGGFVLGTYGAIPADGEEIQVDYGNIQIREIIVQERRVKKATVRRAPTSGEEPEENGDNAGDGASENGGGSPAEE